MTRKVQIWAGQEKVIEDRDHYFNVMLGGVGAGKTAGGVRWWWQRRLRNKQSLYSMIVAPTHDLARNVVAEQILEFLDLIGYKRGLHYQFKSSAGQMQFQFHWGHTAYLRSAENWRRMVGFTISDFWLDEAGIGPQQIIRELVKRARCPEAQCIQGLITGCGEGWLYDWLAADYTPGAKITETKDKLILHMQTYANPRLPDAYIQQLEDEFEGDRNAQIVYLLGGLAPLGEGNVYIFTDADHGCDVEPDPECPALHMSWDFNVGLVGWCAAQELLAPGWAVVAENGKAQSTDAASVQFVEQFPPYYWGNHNILVHGDAAGWHQDTRSPHLTGGDYSIIGQVLKPYYPRLKIVAGRYNPHVSTRVTAVNRAFGKNRLKVSRKLVNLIYSLTHTQYAKSGTGLHKPAGEQVTHMGDALGYFVADEIPILDRAALAASFHV